MIERESGFKKKKIDPKMNKEETKLNQTLTMV